MVKKYFFGWTNIKWIIREFVAMYSNTDSYFSKKRFESSIAFLSGIGIILCNIYYHRTTITNSEVLANAVILFSIAGYTVSKIQSEKKDNLLPAKEDAPAIKEDFSKDEAAI